MKAFVGNCIQPTLKGAVEFHERMLLVVDENNGQITHFDKADSETSVALIKSFSDQYSASNVIVQELGEAEFLLPSFVDSKLA